jgi:hypothetical protein
VARKGTVERVIRVSGQTTAQNAVTLIAPQLRGSRSRSSYSSSDFTLNLLKLAPAGARVGRNDTVAQFDDQYMRLRFDDLQADVRQQEMDLARLRANLMIKRRAFAQRIVAARGAVRKAELDVKTAPVRSAIQNERFRLQLEEARAYLKRLEEEIKFFEISELAAIRRYELDVELAALELRRARVNGERLHFRSPIDGVAVPLRIRVNNDDREAAAGDELRAGSQFLQIVDADSLVVDALLNQADAQKVRPGMKARVMVDALPDVLVPALVESVRATSRATGFRPDWVSHVPMRLTLEGRDARLAPNYSVSADVIVESEEAAAILPLEFVHGLDGDGPAWTLIQSGENRERREIELGIASNTEVAVRSGLEEGDVALLDIVP